MATSTTSRQGASSDTSEHLQQAREHLKEAASASQMAAAEAKSAATAEMDELLDKGRDVLCSAEALIRKHPVAAFGAAFAAGWLLSRLGRHK